METSPTDRRDSWIRTRATSILVLSAGIGISIGLLDLILATRGDRPEFAALTLAVQAVSVTTAVFFVVSALLLSFSSLLASRFQLSVFGASAAIAVTTPLLFVAASLNNLFVLTSDALTNLRSGRTLLILLAGALAAAGTYLIATRIERARGAGVIGRFAAYLPLMLSMAAAALWLGNYGFSELLLVPNLVTALLLAVVIGVATFWTRRRHRPTAGIVLLTMGTLAIPALASWLLASTPKRAPPAGISQQVQQVVLITVDTLRPDYLSFDGTASEARPPTPEIDQLAQDGVRFTRAVSPSSWTKPAFASIMTGLPVMVHGVTGARSELADELPTLGEYFQDAGYGTGAVIRNVFLGPDSNFNQGFDQYQMIGRTSWRKRSSSFGANLFSAARLFYMARGLTQEDLSSRAQTWTPLISQLSLNWVEKHRNRPFFLWVHYFDPHTPYSPPPRDLPRGIPSGRLGDELSSIPPIRSGKFVPDTVEKQWIRQLYAGEISFVDRSVGMFLDGLRESGVYDDALIVFTSDHGEEFWEHGGFEHGHTLHRELLAVPLIVKPPRGSMEMRKTVGALVTTESVLSTVLEIAGLRNETGEIRAESLVPLMTSSAAHNNSRIVLSAAPLYAEQQVSVIFDDYKYIRFMETRREELYDLDRDPGEKISIAELATEPLMRGRELLDRHLALAAEARRKLELDSETAEADLDDETVKTLKALGYIQ